MPTIFTERVDLSEAQYDAATRTLHDVKLISAGTSMNRRHYSEAVLQKAAPLFEGAKAYDSHQPGSRTVGALTGFYKNVRYDATAGALKADRVFSNTQAGRDVQSVVEDIISGAAPKTLAGLSINAVGTGKTQKLPDGGDGLMVESITTVRSVDDVDTPAAGGGYTESKTGDDLALALVEAMTYEEFLEARPEFVDRLRKDFKRVRQEDALKLAEAETQRVQGELQEAQATIEQLTADRDNALARTGEAQRELAIERVLNDPKVKLPVSWRESLRQQLQAADPQQWVGIIETEQRKAGSTGTPRVSVTNAGQQVAAPVQEATREGAPLDWSNILSSPEAFAAFQERIHRR